ncbi:MAG: hypothetical protein MZV70_68675 [Desulfobacterales bacterium]|nr:hypothetical protein [Desulfobacterales bacterium]
MAAMRGRDAISPMGRDQRSLDARMNKEDRRRKNEPTQDEHGSWRCMERLFGSQPESRSAAADGGPHKPATEKEAARKLVPVEKNEAAPARSGSEVLSFRL